MTMYLKPILNLNGKNALFTIALIIVFFSASFSTTLDLEISSSEKDFIIEKTCDGVRIKLQPYGLTPAPGLPHIESRIFQYLLPQNQTAYELTVTEIQTDTFDIGLPPLSVNYLPLDGENINPGKSEPIEQVFPKNHLQLITSGFAMGYSLASIEFYPVKYSGDGRYILLKDVKFTISTIPVSIEAPIISSGFAHESRKRIISAICDNFESFVNEYTTPEIMDYPDLPDEYSIPPLPGDSPSDFLIITDDTLLSACIENFDESIDGFQTRFVTIEEIKRSYFGIDSPERIRKFIQDAYRNWGILALLIAGDYTHIPVRYIFAMGIDGLWYETPSDIYYSALDGTMNSDMDSKYGDSDEDDLQPDIWFSRLQARTESDIIAFANKFDNYRFMHPLDFFQKSLFIGASIHTSGTDNVGAYKKEEILTTFGIDSLFDITRMYSNIDVIGGDYEITADNFIELLSEGFSLMNHFDHGNQRNLSMGSRSGGGSLTISDIAALTNDYFPMIYTFSCDVNRLDTDNIAARWVINPEGGGIGMFAHANTAWSSQSIIDEYLWEIIIGNKPLFAGELLAMWHIRLSAIRPYDVAIVGYSGHPLTPLPFSAPESITISFEPEMLSPDDTTLFVHIEGALLESAIFALSGKHRVFSRIVPDSNDFQIPFKLMGEDSVWLTAYTLPMQRFAIPVENLADASVHAIAATIDEYWGDSDGFAECGEVIMPAWWITNFSDSFRDAISFIEIPFLDIIDSAEFSIAPNETLFFSGKIHPLVDSIGEPFAIDIIVSIEDNIDSFSTTIAGPAVKPITLLFYNNFSEFPSPGDTASLGIVLKIPSVGNFAYGFGSINSIFEISPDSLPIESCPENGFDTLWFDFVIPLDFYGDLPIEFVIENPFAGFSWDLIIRQPAPPESIWVEPSSEWIGILWEPPADTSITGYLLYRCETSDGDFVPITEYPITSSTFSDYALGLHSEYYYFAVSVDNYGNLSIPTDVVYGWRCFESMTGFPADLPLGVWPRAAPVLVDADDDGIKEIYVADIDGHLCAFRIDGSDLIDLTDETDPILIDDVPFQKGFWASPAAADIDNDGIVEIVLTNRNYFQPYLFAIDPWGNPEPGFPLSISCQTLATPVLADLDNDSLMEIIIMAEDRKLYIYRHDGSPYLGDDALVDATPECSGGYGFSSPAVADIDGDGILDIVAGSGDDTLGQGFIYAWSADGSRKPGFPITVPRSAWGSPVLGNIDNDTTTLEIVILVYLVGIQAFDCTGEILPGFPVAEALIGTSEGLRTPALADFDGDGRCEILYSSFNYLSVISPDGTILPGFPVPYGNEHWSGPLVSDINSDGIEEILTPEGNMLMNVFRFRALNSFGELITPGYPLEGSIGFSSPAAIDDIDNDGYLEIIAPSLNSKLYVWRTNNLADTNLMSWSHFRHDQCRTGAIHVAPVGIAERQVKPENVFINISPNPFNSGVKFQVSGVGEQKITIEIYDLRGILVAARDGRITVGDDNRQAPTDNQEFIWQPDGSVTSGVYLVRVRNNKQIAVRKVLYLR